MIHELKTWPEFYDHLENGRKNFEYRRNDRGFREGDTLHLREWEPVQKRYLGREMHRVVTYMLTTSMHSEFAVMSLAPLVDESRTLPAIVKPEEAAQESGSASANLSSLLTSHTRLRTALERLVQRWRDEAAPHLGATGDEGEIAHAKDLCAKELADWLAAIPGSSS